MITPPKESKMSAFLQNYTDDELRIAGEFLSNWLPFLSRDLCGSCKDKLEDGIGSLRRKEDFAVSTPNNVDVRLCNKVHDNCIGSLTESTEVSANKSDYEDAHEIVSRKDGVEGMARASFANETSSYSKPLESPNIRKSWADMALDDELSADEENEDTVGPTNAIGTYDGKTYANVVKRKVALSRDQREYIRFNNVQRNKDFTCLERVNGKTVNILEGLELHKGIFSAAEQKRIVDYVGQLQEMGRSGQLKERTYSAPNKWMRGKGRVTLQFGCCYNYAVDRKGNPPGILKREMVDPLPGLLKVMVKRLVRWHVLPPSCVPDSCIVNIYEEGDCIPPHIDNHDFVRPFCTVSFLSECEILFGSDLKILGPGEFSGSYAIPLPVGSVLVLKGNGADVAKHCVPAVPSKRISITFRRMDESKRPLGSVPEPDLQGLQPLPEEAQGSNKLVASRPEHSYSAVAKGDRIPNNGGPIPGNPGNHFPEEAQGSNKYGSSRPAHSFRNSAVAKGDRTPNNGGPLAGNPGPHRRNRTPNGPRTPSFHGNDAYR